MAIIIESDIVHTVVLSIARRHPWVDVDDLRQEAAIAVMNAIDKFDPDKSDNVKSYIRTVVANHCRNYAWQYYGPTSAPQNGTRQSHVARIKSTSLQYAADKSDDDTAVYAGFVDEAASRDCEGDVVITCIQDNAVVYSRARQAIRFALLQLGEHAELIAAVLSGELSQEDAAKMYKVPRRRVAELIAQARSVFRQSEACKSAFEDLG